jgi:tetratricopeptide (TPR) repeat protein
MALGLASSFVMAQENGESLLDEAVELKLEAKSPRDLDKVADLCEEAIEKGLAEDSLETARKLWASACLEHAELLARRVFSPTPDPRWKFLRQQALERLEKTVELTPDNSSAWLLIAEFNLLEGGDGEAASQAVARALESSTDDPGQQARTLIMRSRTTEDEEQKWADINKALEVEPDNRLGLRIRGQMYTAEEKFDEAIEDFARLAALQENNPVELLLLARALRSNEKNEAALKAVSRAIEINEDLPMAWSLRASLYLAMEKDDEALADVSRAIALNPRDVDGLRTRARVYFQKEKYEEALKDVDKILTFQEGDVDALYLRSFIYAGMEDYEPAIEDMQLLADQIPGEPLFRNALAGLYNSANQPEKAIEIYNDLLKEDSQDQRALAGRGDARLNAGLHAEAVVDYEAALKLDEEDDHVLNNLAWLLSTSTFDDVRNGQRALELATRAAEVTEFKEAHILSTLAAAYAETGDFEKAVEWSEKSVEIASEGRQKEDLQKELETFRGGKPVRENEAEARKKKAGEEAGDEDGDGDDDDGPTV